MTGNRRTLGPHTAKFLLLRTGFFVLVVFPILLLVAGRVDYWQGWVYGGLNLAVLLANVLFARVDPSLTEERMMPGGKMVDWDRVYFAVSSPVSFLALMLATLDAGRFGWSPPLPAGVYLAACASWTAGQALFLWAKWTNHFFSTVVRIQTERGHAVCDRGPYRLVRHPGYLGGILFMIATPLVLGSLWGCVPQGVAVAALLLRTRAEDRMLNVELAGYREYSARVAWRLVPRVW